MKIKKEIFQKSENIGGSFEKLPRFLNENLGKEIKCPKCNNKNRFQIFFDVELMSINTYLDKGLWRIDSPSMGPIKIKNIKCLSCGEKGKEEDFKICQN